MEKYLSAILCTPTVSARVKRGPTRYEESSEFLAGGLRRRRGILLLPPFRAARSDLDRGRRHAGIDPLPGAPQPVNSIQGSGKRRPALVLRTLLCWPRLPPLDLAPALR